MTILGYIVCKNKIKEKLDFIEVVSDYKLIEDKTKPILIIGLEEARKQSSSFSIIEKKLDKNLFWTFGKREKKVDYDKDLVKFQEYVMKQNIDDIKYHYINLLKLNLSSIKRLINIINNNEIKYFYLKKNMIYMYYKNMVTGISMEILSFDRINKKKIYSKLKNNKNNIIHTKEINLSENIKRLIVNKQYIMAYLHTLN